MFVPENSSKTIVIVVGFIVAVPLAVAAVTFTDAVQVTGLVSVTGALSKGSGTFMIDHPLDPKNKLLYHSFVESPDMKNVYDGIATLDESGNAEIELPSYFLALNKDFRYLASSIDGPMPNLHLDKEVGRRYGIGAPVFRISGGEPGKQISWQVTGIRNDFLARKAPIVPVVDKGGDQPVAKGSCLFEPLCN